MDVDATVGRIAELARGYLEGVVDRYPGETEMGTFGIVYELRYPEGGADIGYFCSDGRDWVQAGLFRRALIIAEQVEEAEGVSADENGNPA